MKYRISKPAYDSRAFTHGLVLPDGFSRVVELTRHNGDILVSMERRGYLVEELDEKDKTLTGLYFEGSGDRVTDASALAVTDDPAKNELVRASADYEDPARYAGMPKAELYRRKRPDIKIRDVNDARGARIRRESLEQQVAEASVVNKIGTRKLQ